MPRFLVILIGLALAGCAASPRAPTTPAQPATAKAPGVNLSGYPPAFRDGYADGCNAAKASRGKRDETRYKADPQYAQGWQDGFGVCGR